MSKDLFPEETAWLGDSGKASLESPPPTVSSLTTSLTLVAGFSATFGAGSATVLAGVGETAGVGVEMFSTRSNLSIRDNIPASELSPPGNNIRPQMSSRIKRGAVAPRIWVKPSAAISAQRDKFAAPIFAACVRIRSSWSSGSSRKIELALVAASASTIIKSRKRSKKSLAKRRGSWPDSITRSTVLNSVAPSRAASASTASSSRAPSVKPNS